MKSSTRPVLLWAAPAVAALALLSGCASTLDQRGLEQRTAQAINLLYFLPTAGISLLAHRKNGYLDRTVLRAAVPLGTLCALAAAFLATTLDSSLLRKPFGLFLLYAGASILLEKPENKNKAL